MVSYALEDGIATITMDDGKVNALSSAMIGEISSALDRRTPSTEDASASCWWVLGNGVAISGFSLGESPHPYSSMSMKEVHHNQKIIPEFWLDKSG